MRKRPKYKEMHRNEKTETRMRWKQRKGNKGKRPKLDTGHHRRETQKPSWTP